MLDKADVSELGNYDYKIACRLNDKFRLVL